MEITQALEENADLNNSETEGFIQRWLHKGSSSVGNHAVHLTIPDRVLLCHQPPVRNTLNLSVPPATCAQHTQPSVPFGPAVMSP